MQEGWPALQWSPADLLEKCRDCEVPVEVSSRGGDYRDLYEPGRATPGSTFDAGVPLPLSLLLDSMQQADTSQVKPASQSVEPAFSLHRAFSGPFVSRNFCRMQT